MLLLFRAETTFTASQGGRHGQAVIAGRVVGTNPAVVTTGASETQGWPSTCFRSQLLNWDSLYPEDRDTVGIPSRRDGLWLRYDMLATTAGLAACRCLDENLAVTAGRTRASWRVGSRCGRARQLLGESSFWGADTGPNPTDRGKAGSKRHLLTEGTGIPWAIHHTAANVHDSEPATHVINQRPAVRGTRGPRRRRVKFLLADRAYDAEAKIRQPLRQQRIAPLIAHRNTEHGSGLGQFRYVVESCFDWLFQWRRLRVRYEKRSDIHTAFLQLACAMVCWTRLRRVKQFC